MPKLPAKALVLNTLFSRWRAKQPLSEGYSILLPIPMDMPFLLRYALEGLSSIDLGNCKQVVVVPDGSLTDDGGVFRQIVDSCGDPRVEYAPLGPMLRLAVRQVQKRLSGGDFVTWAHWATIVEATNRARANYLFLHDADAFFIDGDGLEHQYAECRARGMDVLGVEARLDSFFATAGYTIPGTWEMMFSVLWARKRAPILLKGQWQDTPHGRHEFDTTLYPQYLDYPRGKIGVMASPPRLVHFHGTIATYRNYRDRPGRPVVDELFRLLLLSILEDLVPDGQARRILPSPGELAQGLDSDQPSAGVGYHTEAAAREYPKFRKQIDDLCESPTFAGGRALRIREHLRPFDEHFAARLPGIDTPRESLAIKPRRHGLS